MINPQPTTHNRQQEKRFPVLWCLGRWWLVAGSWWPPLLASAQQQITVFKTPASGLNFTTFSNKLSDIADTIIPFLVGVAFVVVMWGVLKYVRSAGDAEKLSEGRKVALWGVVAIFMMLSFWGFVMIIKASLFGN